MFISRSLTQRGRVAKRWMPHTNPKLGYLKDQHVDRIYRMEDEPYVPELNRNLTYDKTIKTIRGNNRNLDKITISTPRTKNNSQGYFRPAQKIDKTRTVPESNGATGQVIPQLARITFRVCPTSISSAGMRNFLDDNAGNYSKFKKMNSSTALYKIIKKDYEPKIITEWCSGTIEVHEAAHLKESDIFAICDQSACRSGIDWHSRVENIIQTRNSSIQGQWTSFSNKNNPDSESFGKIKKVDAWVRRNNKFEKYYRETESLESIYPELSAAEKRDKPLGPYGEVFDPIVDDAFEVPELPPKQS